MRKRFGLWRWETSIGRNEHELGQKENSQPQCHFRNRTATEYQAEGKHSVAKSNSRSPVAQNLCRMAAIEMKESERVQSIVDAGLAACVVLAAVLTSVPAFQMLSVIWQDAQLYGHAYAIPLVSAYFIVRRRSQIQRALSNLEAPALGPAAVLTTGVFLALMVLGDVRFAAGIGIPFVLGAACYAIGGLRLLRPLALPLAFLPLMVPPPRLLTYKVLVSLKLLVTDVAVSVLHAFGRPVIAEGNQIILPGETLYVADACSGLTSIITLLPLAFVVAYFLSNGVWRRVFVVASVIPLAMAANVVRVIITVLLVSRFSAEFARGAGHETLGLVTSVLATLGVIGVARALR